MTKDVQSIDVRLRLTPTDVARLDEQCRRFEWSRTELLRHFIRQGYDALAEFVPTAAPTQARLFPVTMPSGKPLTPPPVHKAPPEPTP